MPIYCPDAEFFIQRDALIADIKHRSDGYVNYILAGYFVTGLLLSFYYHTLGAALFVGGNAIMVYYVVKISLPHSTLYQYLLSAALGIFVVQFTYQMHGMFEMGFFAFIGSAILITYRNWKLQIPIFLIVLLHHNLLGQLLKYGYDNNIYVVSVQGLEVHFFVIHRLLTLLIFFICGLWAYHFQKNEENQIVQNIELRKLQQEALLYEERNRNREKLEAYNNQLIATNRRLELSQKAAEKSRAQAEAANMAKSVFMSNMSHELRTPLNGIIGMAQLLADVPMSEKGKMYIGTIKTCGESLLAIINDILDFAKTETGNMQLEMRDFDLLVCVEEVMDMFTAKAGEKGLELICYVESSVPRNIKADKTRLQQVLINLVGNAIKFTTTGEVFVHVRPADKAQEPVFNLQFEVHDTGTGIPEQLLKNLFKPFSQGDQSPSRRFGGTGLGLVIANNLVKLMGGKITVQSTPGEGSCFTFSAPVTATAQIANIKHKMNMANAEARRILVADGNKRSLAVVGNMLASWGLIPVLAQTLPEAINMMDKEYKPDLVITTAHLPGSDVAEIASLFREKAPELPLILLHAPDTELNPKNAALFRAIVNKPVKHDQLAAVVYGILREKGYRAQEIVDEPPITGRDFSKKFPMQILVAEDNNINSMMILHMLGNLGYQPKLAKNGRETLAAASARDFDVILMDVQMPEMDGLEATRAIRKMLPRQPKIIAVTANALEGDRENCMHAGMNDYMTKPIGLDRLMEMLRRWAPK